MNTFGYDIQDPEYFVIFKSDVSNQNIFERNARFKAAIKISKIIEDEFLNEINSKRTEIYNIFQNLNKACKMLHYLRFAIVTDFYNKKNVYNNDIQILKQPRLHPTVTSFESQKLSVKDISYENTCIEEINKKISRKRKSNDEQYKKLKNKYTKDIVKSPSTIFKVKKRIIVGNISKWISPDFRTGNASHKWTIYIRDTLKSDIDIGQLISRVRFFLHPSYKPNDVVELTSTPFQLSRHGWGEFPIRVQLHFTNNLNKPVDIIHYLKLDRTFTGLQTIGSETIVDLYISMKDIYTLKNSLLIKSANQNSNSVIDKCTKSNLSTNNNIHNDHNYIRNYMCFNREASYLQHLNTVPNSEFYMQKKNISTPENYITLSTKITESKISRKSENLKILPRTEYSVINKYNNFEENSKTSSTIKKYKFNYDLSSQYNSVDHNRKMDFKKDNYIDNDKNLNILVKLIDYIKPSTLVNILKLIIKNLPLITEKSSKLYHKMLYPYTCESYHQFCNYSSGKQRSLERYRAIVALNIIKCTKYNDNICNLYEIIKWARRYCYTPFVNLKNIHKLRTSNKLLYKEDKNELYKYTSTISNHLNTWLIQCQSINLNFINSCSENNEQVDILNVPSNVSDSFSMYHNCFKKEKNTAILIEYPKIDNILNEYVCTSLQKIGIKLMNEEIIPGVIHHTASMLITKVVEYLVDDLIRLAFSCTLDKLKNEKQNVFFIEIDDVRMALLKKEEFEIFTNAGLGSDG